MPKKTYIDTIEIMFLICERDMCLQMPDRMPLRYNHPAKLACFQQMELYIQMQLAILSKVQHGYFYNCSFAMQKRIYASNPPHPTPLWNIGLLLLSYLLLFSYFLACSYIQIWVNGVRYSGKGFIWMHNCINLWSFWHFHSTIWSSVNQMHAAFYKRENSGNKKISLSKLNSI